MVQYKSIPQAQDQRNQSQTDILNNMNYLCAPLINPQGPFGLINVDHFSAADNVANPKTGFHNQVSLINRAAPTSLVNSVNSQSSDGIVYTKTDGAAQQQLNFYRNKIGGGGFEDVPMSAIRAFGNFNGSTVATNGLAFNLTCARTVAGSPVGDYTLTFTTPFAGAQPTFYQVYGAIDCGSFPSSFVSGFYQVLNKTASSFRILTLDQSFSATNVPGFSVLVVGIFS